MNDFIIILDYGSQYTQLIARRVRELNVYSEIYNHNVSFDTIKSKSPSAIILSGGPMSVYDSDSYSLNKEILKLDLPILGICYGMQLLMQYFGSNVISSKIREYGHSTIKILNDESIFKNIKSESKAWMSHGDKINKFDKK